MGYKMNSPVKQVWLPLDYGWLVSVVNTSIKFDVFAKEYEKKYGVDLHDLFNLVYLPEIGFELDSKVDVLSAYNAGLLGGAYNTKMSAFNAINTIERGKQTEDGFTLMVIAVTDEQHNYGHGFNINLPAIGTTVNSIDDLSIAFYEI